MPRVPYQPYSEVAPSGQNISAAEATPQVFGAGVGRSISGLGGEIEQAGDKLFNRAMAFQELANETEAEQGNVRLMSEAGDLHAAYNAKEGQERVAAFPEYKQSLIALQARIRASLSNDDARRKFDRPSLQTVGHSIFNGAGASATAQRQWSTQTAEATMEKAIKSIEDNPTDPGLWNIRKGEIEAAAEQVGQLRYGVGPDSPIVQNLKMKSVSAARRQQILSVNQVDPWQASQMQEEAVTNKELTQQDSNMLEGAVQGKMMTIESANIANGVFQRGQEEGRGMKEMETEARKISAERSKNPLLAEHTVHALKSLVTTDNYIARQEDLTNKNLITSAIANGNYKNEQELLADPKLQNAKTAIRDEAWKAGIPAQINRINASKNQQTNRDNWVELQGMLKNNPIKFLDQDISKWQLSNPDMRHFINEQQKIKDVPYADQRVQQFISWMKPLLGAEMRAAGVYSPPTKAEGGAAGSDYDKFAGLVSVGIEEYVQEHGKPPKGTEAVKEIGQRVLRGVTEPTFFGLFSSDVPYFKKTLGKEYEDFKKDMTQEAITKGEGIPTEDQMERTYRQMDYMRFYGKPKSTSK